MTGREFVVFVAEDAGSGRLVAIQNNSKLEYATSFILAIPQEGSDFTEEHPRLHYGWKTTKEYRHRFGFLDYMCRHSPEEPYLRDAGPPVELPADVENRCRFVLYPYVHATFAEAVTWEIHSEAIERIRNGDLHPASKDLLRLARLAAEQEKIWQRLSEPEQLWELSRGYDSKKQLPTQKSAALNRYLKFDRRLSALSASLQASELAKVRQALARLDDWLLCENDRH